MRDYTTNHVLGTYVDGRLVFYRNITKRAKPPQCEICGKPHNRMGYHHWNPKTPHIGMWLCASCHRGAEFYERGRLDLYLEKKAVIDATLK